MDDTKELLRLTQLMIASAHQEGVATLQRYMADEYLLTYSLYEQEKHGFMTKEQIIAKWGSQLPGSGTCEASEQRVLLSGDTAIVYGLITDKIPQPDGEKISRTWVSDTWVKRHGEWRWLASHESFLK